MGYSKQAFIGISWMAVFRILSRLIAFLKIYILARLLVPAQFGIFGIASLVLVFLETLTETGINVLLVQEKDNIDKHISTYWIVSIARGLIMFLVIIFLSPLIVNFYNSPEAYPVLIVAAFVPLVRGFINPSVAKFQKELKFNVEFIYRFSIFLIESIIAIIIVVILRSPIGLAWGLVAGAMFEVVLSFSVVKPRPGVNFDKCLFMSVISRGKWITMSGIFSYMYHNGANVVVGRKIGVSALGIYDITYRISILPITEIADTISKVIFPVYVKISGDIDRLKKAFLKTLAVVSALCIPIGIVFFIFPKEIITIILGDKWLEAIPILQVLAIFGVIRAVSGVSSTVFLSVKKQEYSAIVMFVSFLTLMITIIPFLNIFGIVGAGLSILAGSVAALPFIAYFLIRIFNDGFKRKSA